MRNYKAPIAPGGPAGPVVGPAPGYPVHQLSTGSGHAVLQSTGEQAPAGVPNGQLATVSVNKKSGRVRKAARP